MKPRIIERASPAHRVWQLLGWAILIVGILVLAKGQPNYRLLLMSNAAALSVAILGLNLVVGFSGQISLGHSAFFGFGGYTAAVLIVDHDWPFLATLPVAAVFGGVLGFILGTIGKGVLRKAFENSVKAIEARNGAAREARA